MPPEPRPVAAPPPSPAARIVALADACVRCGLCLPHCPTYVLDRVEAESPRGRIMLLKALAEGRIAPEPATFSALDHCLACRNCERVCPAQVRYGELLVAGRTEQRTTVPPDWKLRLALWLMPRKRWLATALRLANALRHWPGAWRRLPAAPSLPPLDSHYPAAGAARGRVALFLGCLGPHHDAAAARAAIRLLTRLGWEVDVPAHQGCCGALHRHAGAAEEFDLLARRNQAAFDTAGTASPYAAILSLASGCHESIAQALGGETPPVREALAFIAQDEQVARLPWRRTEAAQRIALHLPCTQRNVTRSDAVLTALLARVPGIDVAALTATGCCGAAGSHMLTEPTRAAALREPWLDAIARSRAATLCSANVGCRLHLGAGIEQRGIEVATRHPLELLAEHLDDRPDPTTLP